MLDIAEHALEDKKLTGAAADEVRQLAKDRTFNKLAMKLGVKVIHCSERDTQISDKAKHVDEFVNTWSIEGFREEGDHHGRDGLGDAREKPCRRTRISMPTGRAIRSAWLRWA